MPRALHRGGEGGKGAHLTQAEEEEEEAGAAHDDSEGSNGQAPVVEEAPVDADERAAMAAIDYFLQREGEAEEDEVVDSE